MSWFADFFWTENYDIGAGVILVVSGLLFLGLLSGCVFSESGQDSKEMGRIAFVILVFGPLLALTWHLIVPLAAAVALLVMLVIAFRKAKFGEIFKKESDMDEVDA